MSTGVTDNAASTTPVASPRIDRTTTSVQTVLRPLAALFAFLSLICLAVTMSYINRNFFGPGYVDDLYAFTLAVVSCYSDGSVACV